MFELTKAVVPVKAKTVNPLTLEAVRDWLKTKPGNEPYEYSDAGKCLAAQYNRSIGREYELSRVGTGFLLTLLATGTLISRKPRNFDERLEALAATARPRTFGGALKLVEKKLAA